MALEIISAAQRLNDQTVKGVIFGVAGVGKTTLLKTLDPATTLCISAEGGLLSVQRDDEFGPRWLGDVIEPSSWPELKAILEGFKTEPRPPALAKYKTVFIDSITVAAKWCFEWCCTQPDAFNKQGVPNKLGAYGLLGTEFDQWQWGWKKLAGVNVWLVGGIQQKDNDVGSKDWKPLLMGATLVASVPYVMDFVVVMARFKAADGNTYTGFHTDPKGEFGTVPVKTRGGGFAPIEQPHLGKLTAKALGLLTAGSPPPSVTATTATEKAA